MVRCFTYLLLLTILSGCSGWDVSLSDEKTPQSRKLATITHFDEDPDDEAFAFDLMKRPKSIMAEKKFYEDGKFSASFAAGHKRQQHWITGINLNYSF